MPRGRELRHEIEKRLEELQTLRDELRVRAHLASLELRDKLDELETQFGRVEEQMKESAEKFREALGDLAEAYRALREKLPRGERSKAA